MNAAFLPLLASARGGAYDPARRNLPREAHMRVILFALTVGMMLALSGCARGNNQARRLPKPRTMDARKAPVLAGKDSKVYHRRSCQFAGELQRTVGYSSYLEAERVGLIPCQFCNPRTRGADRPQTPAGPLIPVPDK
jgi:hypothetical protein